MLLLDEPLSALDPFLRIRMRAELKSLQTRLGITFVHVTHSQEEAMALADLIVVMNDGRIEQAATAARRLQRAGRRPSSRASWATTTSCRRRSRGRDGEAAFVAIRADRMPPGGRRPRAGRRRRRSPASARAVEYHGATVKVGVDGAGLEALSGRRAGGRASTPIAGRGPAKPWLCLGRPRTCIVLGH